LTNALRRDPPPVGSSVTYRYRDLTSSGLPRFATFVRRHEAL
jgi:DNA ligase-1